MTDEPKPPTAEEVIAAARKWVDRYCSDGNVVMLQATGLIRELLDTLDAKDAEIERLTAERDLAQARAESSTWARSMSLTRPADIGMVEIVLRDGSTAWIKKETN